MNTKLTLSLDKKVIERSKKYARAKGQSLSKLIEEYLQGLTSKKNSEIVDEESLHPKFLSSRAV